MKQKRNILASIGMAFTAMLMSLCTTSCEHIFDYIDACRYGVNLRFVYDYNMEYANAFPSKVDCVTLLVYDENGNFVTSRTETSDVLRNEDYRMTIDLSPGNYRFVAYGGLACDASSFTQLKEPSQSLMTDLQTLMNFSEGASDKQLHPFFFGPWDTDVTKLFDGTTVVTVPDVLPSEIPADQKGNYKDVANGDVYVNHTIKMMKNTNNIRIVLQQLNGDPVSNEEFTIWITDDNTKFRYDDVLMPNGMITYHPWAEGQQSVGVTEEEGLPGVDKEVLVSYDEFSTSRLMADSQARLVIVRNDTGDEIVNIPLVKYLLLLKSAVYADMGAQEFLDRESEWNLIFFLDTKHAWMDTHIVINDWVIRFNDTEF